MDILEDNRQAWNRESLNDGEWSVPVSEEIISAARNGAWQVVLTPLKPVPKSWCGNLHGKKSTLPCFWWRAASACACSGRCYRCAGYPNGQLNPDAYPRFACTFALVLAVAIWISAYGTHSQIPQLPQAAPTSKRCSLRQVAQEAGQAFALRSSQVIVLTAVLWGMTMGMVSASSS